MSVTHCINRSSDSWIWNIRVITEYSWFNADPRIHIIRATERLGLIRARITGTFNICGCYALCSSQYGTFVLIKLLFNMGCVLTAFSCFTGGGYAQGPFMVLLDAHVSPHPGMNTVSCLGYDLWERVWIFIILFEYFNCRLVTSNCKTTAWRLSAYFKYGTCKLLHMN